MGGKDKGKGRWVQVRLDRSTLAKLREWGRDWQERGLVALAIQGGGERPEPSVDAVILELMRRVNNHRARSKTAKHKRRVRAANEREAQLRALGDALKGNEYIDDDGSQSEEPTGS